MLKTCNVCGRRIEVGAGCPEHGTPDSRRRERQRVHGRNTRVWRRLREERIALARGWCELKADDGCTGAATTVHLDPALGGDHRAATLDDVRAACAHCHGVVDAPRAQLGGLGAPGEARQRPPTGGALIS